MGLNNQEQTGLRASAKHLFNGFFSYTSMRTVKIDSVIVGIIFRVFQIALLTYIIGWELMFKKGYQSFDPVSSTVTTKVKGFGYLKQNDSNIVFSDNISYRIFDTADYVIPPSEYNSFFVLTSFVSTDQKPGLCPEDITKANAICKEDSDCEGINQNTWNGIPTGKCIDYNTTLKTCQINAWCPVEDDSSANLIQNVLNFTVFIKNDVEFKAFGERERNILPNLTNSYIATCVYDPVKDPYCPVFRLEDIVVKAEPDPVERSNMLRRGGVVQIEIQWNCDYDLYSKKCQPKYSFERFDLPFKRSNAASGFNFRYADKYKVGSEFQRTLVKAYGLRFIIIVSGEAGKLSILPLFLTVGAGLGLLSISTMLADCFMSNFSKKRKFYRNLTVFEPGPEDEETFNKSLNTNSINDVAIDKF